MRLHELMPRQPDPRCSILAGGKFLVFVDYSKALGIARTLRDIQAYNSFQIQDLITIKNAVLAHQYQYRHHRCSWMILILKTRLKFQKAFNYLHNWDWQNYFIINGNKSLSTVFRRGRKVTPTNSIRCHMRIKKINLFTVTYASPCRHPGVTLL